MSITSSTVLAGQYQRVISLAPNITEMIYLLEADDVLVGITSDCDYPAKARAKDLTGPFGKPDLEKIVALQPDLILYAEFEDVAFVKKLDTLGITCVQITIESFADLQFQMLKIGGLLGKGGQAKVIVRSWENRLRAVQEQVRGKRPVRVYFELWGKPRISAGHGSFIDALIRLAGGTNITGQFALTYPKPAEEFIIAADPELIVLGHTTSSNVSFPDTWKDVTAIKRGSIVNDIDPNIMLRPGPRLFDGLELFQQRVARVRALLAPTTNRSVR